ncbi:Hypothetical predicted protein [Octopus vulgaris]|uniref:Uncharacterized protein n=1 Tax=Octopus vulgaris TaxID=6645 RepID=A0AA36B8G0_OCTVU|nr:Hypothetical predicted protein [Octopus vulgaris]
MEACDKVKVENVMILFLKCDISNAMDGTKDDILYNTDDEVEVKSPEPDWILYDDGVCDKSCDMYEKLLETHSDANEEFDGF